MTNKNEYNMGREIATACANYTVDPTPVFSFPQPFPGSQIVGQGGL